MNTSLADAIVLATTVKNNVSTLDIDVVLCPPFVWLYPVAEILEHAPRNLFLGSQNMWFSSSGTMTGEISPVMLKPLAKYVIIGHSERRQNFQETNDLVNDKVKAAIDNHLVPVLCVGELKKMQEEKRGRGRPTKVDVKSDVIGQMLSGLYGLNAEEAEKAVICYEPVWAISRGTEESRHPADGSYANAVVEKLRDAIAKKYNQETAERIMIIYGGSVDEDNIKEFIYQPEIDGVMVGGASLKAKEFVKICREAAGKD